jgi:hypothetical protein
VESVADGHSKVASRRTWLYVVEILARLVFALYVFQQRHGIFSGDLVLYLNRARSLSLHHLPYVNFVWEYPPLTIVPLLIGPLVHRSAIGFDALFMDLTILLEYGSLCLIRRHEAARFKSITVYWSLVVVPLSALGWFRLDYISVFAATVALLRMRDGRSTWLPICLGYLGKLWPIVIAGGLAAERKKRDLITALGSCFAVTVIWWALTPSGFSQFLKYRAGIGFQVESIPGSLLRLAGRSTFFQFEAFNVSDRGFHWLQPLLVVASAVLPVLIAVLAYRRTRFVDATALSGAIVCVILCFSRILSPQYLTWLVPFVVLLMPYGKRLPVAFAICVYSTQWGLIQYGNFVYHSHWWALIFVFRNVVLVYMTVYMLRIAFSPIAAEAHPTLTA